MEGDEGDEEERQQAEVGSAFDVVFEAPVYGVDGLAEGVEGFLVELDEDSAAGQTVA